MFVAALDTSCGAALAVRGDDVDLSLHRPLTGRDSDRLLVPWIADILSARGLTAGDIGRWSVGTGPGSFSGIRAGVAFVKGLCSITGAPYRGIPSSLALAYSTAETLSDGDCVGVLHDARRRQLILTGYVRCGARLQLESGPQVIGSEALASELERYRFLATPHPSTVFSLLPEELHHRVQPRETLNAVFLLNPPGLPWPDDKTASELSVEPVYVRPPVFVEPAPVRPAEFPS